MDIARVDERTFGRLWEAVEDHAWGEARLRVPAFVHLIALKLHAAKSRHRTARDVADVFELLRLNPGRCAEADLEATCLRYGPPGICQQLENFPPYEHPQP